MDIKCCKCKKEYDLANNIFEYKKDTNCPILICPYCDFKHVINFMPFEKTIKVKKIKKLDLTFTVVILGASRIADANRNSMSAMDDGGINPWEIAGAYYTNKYMDVEHSGPTGIFFKPDGTKVYVVAYPDTVYQYTLSTAWDISTATYDDKSKDLTDETTYPYGIAFNPDGTKFYVVAPGLVDKVLEYGLSTAWDISTATYDGVFKSIGAQASSGVGLYFKSDGTRMFITDGGNDSVFSYTLSTPWLVSSATYDDKTFDLSNEDGLPHDVAFNSDGTKMYIMGYDNSKVFQYTLSTSWDVSTASYDSEYVDVSIHTGWFRHFYIKSDGTKMYIVGYTTHYVYQYAMNWIKTNNFILATRIYTSKGPLDRAYKLRWRNVTDSGVFVDVGATGEINYSATTDLTDEDDLLLTEKLCDVQNGYTWQNGKENEGDNILPNSGTYSLADEYYTELQWALDCNGALDEHKYEFELWDITEGGSIGTCLASITMGITPSGFKWNTKTILKWCGKVISKWNGLE